MRQKFQQISKLAAPSMKSYVVAATMVLISSLAVTWWTWDNAQRNLNKDLQTTLDSGANGARDTITNAVSTYGEVLNGAAGLFKSMPLVDAQAWKDYVSNLNIRERYPGLQALAFSEVVKPESSQAFIDERRADTNPNYTISPSGQREVYVPVRFLEPLTPDNAPFIGFDFFSEPIRRKAFESARDTGKPSISGRLILKSDQDNPNPEPGFNLIVPVYAKNASVATVAERQAAIIGYISAGVRTHQLIDGLFGKTLTKDTAVRIYNGDSLTNDNLIYESATFTQLIKQSGLNTTQVVFNFGDNKWTLVGYVNKNVATVAQRNQPHIILITGVLFSFMLSGLLLVIMITRARSISDEKNKEVQEAKDSLISLASHQLRTPATGVKQFLGMVLEGYAGKLTKEQYRMLEKANQSNERQLEIINQILHVTRADSGRLVLHKERVELTHIINTVIEEHALPVKQRSQRVVFSRQSKKIYIQADQQYLTMALDNLLSNASKYSHAKTTIRITVEEVGPTVIITVTDRGVGIHADDMHRLFQKFSRIDNELSVEAGGNGIGLYLCREIIALHHGTVRVNSEPGKGSSFIIELPKGRGLRRN